MISEATDLRIQLAAAEERSMNLRMELARERGKAEAMAHEIATLREWITTLYERIREGRA